MTILATAALIVLIFAGIMVLKMKSDPMEKESVRKLLADKPSSPEAASTSVSAFSSTPKETGSEEARPPHRTPDL